MSAYRANLTEGTVRRRLFLLSGPVLAGMFSMVTFNLADTVFVARLGTDALAAISFTFPVIILVHSLALGLGAGTASAISRAAGRGDQVSVTRLATHSLVLAMVAVFMVVLAGLSSIGPLFRALGAGPALLPLIREYMAIWYVGALFVVIPMVGNNALRAVGNTWHPGLIMVSGAVLNLFLDPLLIFGLGPVPRMGIRGAALATLIARAATMVLSLAILHWREHLLDLSASTTRHFAASARTVLHVGVPTAMVQAMMPVSMAVVTRLAAGFGPGAVAAFGANGRLQTFALLPLFALCSVMVPFAGQNWGADRPDRVRLAWITACRFCLAWGFAVAIPLALLARPIAGHFSGEHDVIETLVVCLRITAFGFGAKGICLATVSVFNGMNRPWDAALLSALRLLVFALVIPYLASRVLGLEGIFWGLLAANLLAALTAARWGAGLLPSTPRAGDRGSGPAAETPAPETDPDTQ